MKCTSPAWEPTPEWDLPALPLPWTSSDPHRINPYFGRSEMSQLALLCKTTTTKKKPWKKTEHKLCLHTSPTEHEPGPGERRLSVRAGRSVSGDRRGAAGAPSAARLCGSRVGPRRNGCAKLGTKTFPLQQKGRLKVSPCPGQTAAEAGRRRQLDGVQNTLEACFELLHARLLNA